MYIIQIRTISKLMFFSDIWIGLCDSSFLLNMVPLGWHKNSVGINSHGTVWQNEKRTCFRGLPYKTGDVIGCGIDITFFTSYLGSYPIYKLRFFFTKNGKINGNFYFGLYL